MMEGLTAVSIIFFVWFLLVWGAVKIWRKGSGQE